MPRSFGPPLSSSGPLQRLQACVALVDGDGSESKHDDEQLLTLISALQPPRSLLDTSMSTGASVTLDGGLFSQFQISIFRKLSCFKQKTVQEDPVSRVTHHRLVSSVRIGRSN